MSTNKLTIANPYNDKHIAMFRKFEKDNGISFKIADALIETKNKNTEEEHQKVSKISNEVTENLFIEDKGTIIDACHIQGEKDIKTCTVFFAPLKQTSRKRPLIEKTMDYAFNVLNMEEVFVSIEKDNKSLQDSLEKQGFENLGDNNGNITFIKERDLTQESERVL